MAFDEALAARFRALVDGLVGISEQKMMGAMCFMLNGNMIGAADRTKDGASRFLFRVGKDNRDIAATLPGAQEMEMSGRVMRGFFLVDADDHDDDVMRQWLSLALSFNADLPHKPAKARDG